MKKINTASIIIALFSGTQTLAAEPLAQTNVGLKAAGLDAVLQASLIVQIVMLILISLSILCWAIAWSKHQDFNAVKKANEVFDHVFWKSSSLDELNEKIDSFKDSSHARVFKSAYVEMKKLADEGK